MNPKNFEELTLSNILVGSACDDLCAMLKENTNLKRLKLI
jgi:hypothetical protein